MVVVWYKGQVDPSRLRETHEELTDSPGEHYIELGEHDLGEGMDTGQSHGAGATLHNQDYGVVCRFFGEIYGGGDGLVVYLAKQSIDSNSLPASRALKCRARVFRKKGLF